MITVYNRVMDDSNDICPIGELLTDKELERLPRVYPHMRPLNTVKVIVRPNDIYSVFGVRFADSYKLLQEK